MFCRVEIVGRTLENVVVIPAKALQASNEVFVAASSDDGMQLERRRVSVALTQGESVVLTRGLEPGDKVITTALPKAMAGMPLSLRGDTPTPGVAAK